ncbi:MAG: FAD-dependent oxidoreductase [Gammaproteobacteria bacterium]|nr:FAD-dependent oxidoreductase [Gammaproteobacteria bacterium]
MRTGARVVIIGGGVVGASCLYHLCKAGVRDCLLIEKNELTSGSTWHAAGNVPTYANSWLGMRAGNYAWRLYRNLSEAAGSPITYRHTGAFWPAHTRDRMDSFRHIVGVSKSAGYELAMLDPPEMEAMHPYYKAGDAVIGGIYDPYEGDIDPSQLTQALAKGGRDAGAEVARFTTVIGIRRNAGGEWVVETDRGEVVCEAIVNATGFYGSRIAAMTGQSLPIATLKHQYIVTEAIDALEQDKALFPLVRDPDIRFYLRRERAGLLFGSYGHPGRLAFPDGLPDEFAHSLFEDSVDDIVDLIGRAAAHVSLLADIRIQRFVNGPIAYSPDALPLCGPAGGLPDFYHACGIQVGITHSAAVGKAIAEWITAGETEWDYAVWDPRRFGDWATPEYARRRIVELYDLQYAIPFPNRNIRSGRPVQKTPLYQALRNRGAVFGQIAGWERAFWFDQDHRGHSDLLSFRTIEPWRDPVRRECEAVRDAVGIMDHGGFSKFEIEGPGSTAFLARVFCGRLPEVGRVRLAYMLTAKGRIWSEATIARLDRNQYLLCGPTLADQRDYDWLCRYLPGDGSVRLRRGSRRDGVLMVMGPGSRDLLSGLCDADLSRGNMPWMSVEEIRIADFAATAMRVSYVGELGWELHLSSENLEQVYLAICQVGTRHGLVDFGSYALNAMRIEKAYHGWGAELGVEYTMFDAGLEKHVDLQGTGFIGREAVLRQGAAGPEWRYVRLIVDIADSEPMLGDPILHRGKRVGYVTSASCGYRIGKVVALGYLQGSVPLAGLDLEIEILGEGRRATISEKAFYDPENHRCRG